MKKNVTVKEMTLLNFKGIRNRTIEFGQTTEIRGANATGKSTINDAFTWALFGKDAQGNSDTKFGIKTVGPDGNPYEKLDHEVTVVLDVNGEEITIKRRYTEKWVTKRGSSDAILEGHTTEYFYNGVPLKESEYKAKINALIEEQLFKMITNPLHFAGLDWQVQREILLQIAGGVSYEEIANSKAEFKAILTQLSGKDLAEFKAEISARKKKIQEELDKIPTRIDEITRNTPVTPDYKVLETEKERLTKALDEVDTAMNDKSKANREHYEKVQGIQKEINAFRSEQQNILFEAKQTAQKEGYEKNAKANEVKNQYEAKKREFDSYIVSSDREISDINRNISTTKAEIEGLNTKVEAKRKEWSEKDEETYQISTTGLTCPIYKTLCSDASVLKMDSEAKEKAKKAFEEKKEEALQAIYNAGCELNNQIAEKQKVLEDYNKQLTERTTEISNKKTEYSTELGRLSDLIKNTPLVEINTNIKGEDLPTWNELEAKINALSSSIGEDPVTDNAELTAQKRSLTAELDEVKRKLSLRSVIESNDKRKAELLSQEKDLAQQKADLEKQEFVIDEFTKARMEEVERRVNEKFQLVKFRMYSKQINGGEKPDCILISKTTGAKFLDTNNADKINIGLDIINTLCDFHQVSAPIFIDNAEGVNEVLPVTSQLIKLVVTRDEELTII
jgi:DNA repair exonuclease SbcCD ATPase subunit